MRYVTVLATPQEGTFHPLGAEITAEPAIERRAIHRVELLEDGTCAMLAAATGDLDRLRAILDGSEHVVEFSVSGDRKGFSYSRFEPNDLVERLMLNRRRSEVVIDMPVRIVGDGSMRATYIGHQRAFTRALADVPDGIDIEVLRTGEYHPEMESLFMTLTARQQEVLRAAVAAGYYETPRAATYEDVAAGLDCSASTVGEHLRKIESRVFAEMTP